MTPKEKAEELLKEFDSLNDAKICANEIIYDYKHYIPDGEEKLAYWKKVREELEKMSNNQK